MRWKESNGPGRYIMLGDGGRRKKREGNAGKKQTPGYQSSFLILRILRGGLLDLDERDQRQKHFPLRLGGQITGEQPTSPHDRFALWPTHSNLMP